MNLKLSYSLLSLTMGIAITGCGERAGWDNTREVPVMAVSHTDSITIREAYAATVEGRQDVEIYPQVSGTLRRVCVSEGQEVGKGQLLFIIDQVPYKAALGIAQANVKAAESNVATARLERDSKKALYEGKVVSEYELLKAQNTLASGEAALEQAKAALLDARNNLSYTEVRSPAAGVVGTLPYRAGSLVSPQIVQPLTSVSDNAEMWVYFSLSEKELQELMRRHGSRKSALAAFPPVGLTLVDGKEYAHAGHVAAISGIVNPETGAVQLKAVFPNPEQTLLSGGIGNVVVPRTERNVKVIPRNATYEIQDKVYAYRVKNGTTESVELSVAPISDGNSYIVKDGLRNGDTIVVEGVGSLREGQPVRTREAEK